MRSLFTDHDTATVRYTILVQCADIVGRAFATGRVLIKHENELDHARTHDQLQQTLQEVEKCCGAAVG